MIIWLFEKELIWWVKSHWNPKGKVDLKLGSKSLFTTIFVASKEGGKCLKMASIYSTM
jgi:hypothetical protein